MKKMLRTGLLLALVIGSLLTTACIISLPQPDTDDPIPDADPHTHTYATTWSSDATLHWHAAVCGHDLRAGIGTHSPETIPAVPATETAAGSTEGSRCRVCQRVLVAPQTVPPLAHTHTYATEWSSDGDGHWHADTCGHSTRADEDYHTPQILPAVPATEEAGGLTEGANCSVCGYVIIAQQETPRLDTSGHTHTYSRYYSYNDTEHWHAAICEHTSLRADVAPHVFTNWRVTRAASCFTDGLQTRACSCGKTETRPIPAIGAHTPSTPQGKAPTCQEGGYTDRTICEVCQQVLVEGQTVPALGHSYTFTVTKEPTKYTEGTRLGICGRCQDEVTETIPRTNTTETPIHYFGNGKKEGENE